jgi:hypothetical protein
VFSAIIAYISRRINRSNKAKGSEASTLEGMLAFGSQRSPRSKGSIWTSFSGFASSIIPFRSSVVNCAISSALAFFLAFPLISNPSIPLQRPWIALKLVGSVVGGIIDDLVGFVGFAAGFLCLAGGLGATEGFEGPGNCAIWPSKWTLGLLVWRDRMDVPSQCTIVRAMGRSAYSSKQTHKRNNCIPYL